MVKLRIGRWLAAALVAAGGSYVGYQQLDEGQNSQPVSGSYRSAYYQTASESYAGLGRRSEQFSLLVRHHSVPNTAAVDSGWILADSEYDAITESTPGGWPVRYGWIQANNPTTVYYYTVVPGRDFQAIAYGLNQEYDRVPSSSSRFAFVWFDTRELEQGMKINSAYICFNVARNQTATIADGEFLYARLDTVPADYAVLDGTVAEYNVSYTDSARFDFSWTYVDADVGVSPVAWSPTMAERDDYNDFGPRSDDGVAGPVSETEGVGFRIDVTSALQLWVDAGHADEGALFLFYGSSGTVSFPISCGSYEPTVGVEALGNPSLVVDAETSRGGRMWGTGKIPWVFTFDDNQDEQVGIFDEMDALGLKFVSASSGFGISLDSPFDTLNTEHAGEIYYLNNGASGNVGLRTATAGEIDNELRRDWFADGSEFTTPIDTTGIVDFAWPGVATDQYGVLAVERMIANGYRSARGSNNNPITPIGPICELYWDYPVNAYAIVGRLCTGLMLDTGSPAGEAYMREYVRDWTDRYWNLGHAAMIMFGHSEADGLTPGQVTQAINIINEFPSTQADDFDRVMNYRIGNPTFLDPGTISTGLEDLDTSAAVFDSVKTADSATWPDSVFVEVK